MSSTVTRINVYTEKTWQLFITYVIRAIFLIDVTWPLSHDWNWILKKIIITIIGIKIVDTNYRQRLLSSAYCLVRLLENSKFQSIECELYSYSLILHPTSSGRRRVDKHVYNGEWRRTSGAQVCVRVCACVCVWSPSVHARESVAYGNHVWTYCCHWSFSRGHVVYQHIVGYVIFIPFMGLT